jgi:spore germination cell wall hydrolase CwlJ-like protein
MHYQEKPKPVKWVKGQAGAGRGFVNPPTIAEMEEQKCLATMVYGEARSEPLKGQIAVAFTAINRAKNKSVCDVVLKPKQYSIFNNNPALRMAAQSLVIEPVQKNSIDNASWQQATAVASAVLQAKVTDPTGGATHYLADKVMHLKGYHYPQWSKEYKLVMTIDNHKFYKKPEKV